jgi:hypothetical protein
MIKYEWGTKVIDVITGFTGIITGYASYMTGCDKYLIQPFCENEWKYPEGEWLDEGRLKIVEVEFKENVKSEKNGCDYSAPIK